MRTLLFLLFTLVAGSANAKDCALQQVASFDVVIDSNGVAAPITVNGRSGYFLLDLNASFSQLTQPVAEALQLRMMPTRWDKLVLAYGHEVVKVVNQTIHFGNASFQMWTAVVSPPWKDDPKLLGVLARDFLLRFDLELDLAHNKVNLFSHDHCPGQVVYWTHSAPVAAVNYVFPQTRLYLIDQTQFTVPMKLDGKDVKGEITLDPVGSIFPSALHDRSGFDPASASLTFKSLELDGIQISNPRFDVMHFGPGTNCNPGMLEPYATDSGSRDRVTNCSINCDLKIGIPELRALRVFLAPVENKLYATAADAN